jgi:nucleoside-diphosphate-sugar epimerase
VPAGLDYVYYTAAAGDYRESAYRAAYVEGVGNLLAALSHKRQKVARIFFTSSTGVYAQTNGEWVDEDSPAKPDGFSGKLLLEGERLVLAGPYPGVVIRFAGIYGPGRQRLLDRVRRQAPCQAVPPLYTNRIHRDDCARVLRHLLSLSSPAALYLGVDDEPAEECVVMDWLAGRLGLPPPPRVSQTTKDPARRANKRCCNRRLRASGYRFHYPSYREGYAAVLEL